MAESNRRRRVDRGVRRGGAQRAAARARTILRAGQEPDAGYVPGRVQFLPDHVLPGLRGFGGNWSVDYPRADVNLSIRLSELTKTRISTDASGEPDHIVISLTDPALFECPFVMMTEVGNAYISPEEAVKLREYLQKGGFLWADDFWGSYAWEHWEQELGKVLPPNEYKVFELPKDHPLFRQQFQICQRQADRVDQLLDGQRRRHVRAAARTAPWLTRWASPTSKDV